MAFGVVAACLYVPFGWLLLEDWHWQGDHGIWLRMWPILPGLLPAAVLFHPQESLELVVMSLITLTLVVGLTWLAARGRWSLLAAAGIALLVAIPTSYVAHSLYWF